MKVEKCKHEGCCADILAGRGFCGRHGGIKRWQELQRKADNAERRAQVKAERDELRAKRDQRRKQRRQRRRRAKNQHGDPRFRRLENKRRQQGSSRAGGAPNTGLKGLAKLDAQKRKQAEAEAAAKAALKQAKAEAEAEAQSQSNEA